MKKVAKYEDIIKRAESGEQVSLKDEGVNATLYWAYRKSKDLGQKYLDFNDVIWDNQIPEIVEQLHEAGKKKFTISGGYTGMATTINEFIKNGCKLNGMTSIKSHTLDWETRENKIIPAFLLTIKEAQ